MVCNLAVICVTKRLVIPATRKSLLMNNVPRLLCTRSDKEAVQCYKSVFEIENMQPLACELVLAQWRSQRAK